MPGTAGQEIQMPGLGPGAIAARNSGMVPEDRRLTAKMSLQSLKSDGTRSEAQLSKKTVVPSPLKTGVRERLFALESLQQLTLSSMVAPVSRSQRNTSGTPLKSPGTRLEAALR